MGLLEQVIGRIPDNVFDSKKIVERQLNPRGHKTKLLTFQDAIEFVMVLPGQTAMAVRQQFARIIRQYIAGERSLIAEINANAESNSPLTQMARAAAPEEDAATVGFKRRREELELFKLEEEVRAMARTRLANLKNDLEELADPSTTKLDERTRLMFKDSYMNLLMAPPSGASGQQGALAITAGPSASNAPISISGVATALGYKLTTNESKRVGIDIRKRYQRLHGKPPPKHDQLCDGRVTLVNSYTEQDRPLVTEALHAFFAPDDAEENDPSDS
jgi:hypothetical protein